MTVNRKLIPVCHDAYAEKRLEITGMICSARTLYQLTYIVELSNMTLTGEGQTFCTWLEITNGLPCYNYRLQNKFY